MNSWNSKRLIVLIIFCTISSISLASMAHSISLTDFEIPTKRESELCPFIGVNEIHLFLEEHHIPESKANLLVTAIRDNNRSSRVGNFVVKKGTREHKIMVNVGGCAVDIQLQIQTLPG